MAWRASSSSAKRAAVPGEAPRRVAAAGKNIDVYNSIGHHGNSGGSGCWRRASGGRPRWMWRVRWRGRGGSAAAMVTVDGSTAAARCWCRRRCRTPPPLPPTLHSPDLPMHVEGSAVAVRQTCPILVLYLLIRLAVASSRTLCTAVARNSSHASRADLVVFFSSNLFIIIFPI